MFFPRSAFARTQCQFHHARRHTLTHSITQSHTYACTVLEACTINTRLQLASARCMSAFSFFFFFHLSFSLRRCTKIANVTRKQVCFARRTVWCVLMTKKLQPAAWRARSRRGGGGKASQPQRYATHTHTHTHKHHNNTQYTHSMHHAKQRIAP